MCFGGGGHDRELEIARESAAKATARANAALAAAREAVKKATAAAVPAGDSEQAQRAAEQQWKKIVAEGTYTRNFRSPAHMKPASIGYRLLTGEVEGAA